MQVNAFRVSLSPNTPGRNRLLLTFPLKKHIHFGPRATLPMPTAPGLDLCHPVIVHLTLTFKAVCILVPHLPSSYNFVVLGLFGSFLSFLAQVCVDSFFFFSFFIVVECTKHKLTIFIILKCTIRWHQGHLQDCATIHSHSRTFSSPQMDTLCPSSNHSHPPPHPASSWQPLSCFPSLCSSISY